MSASLKGRDPGEFQPPPPLQPSAVVQKVDTPDSAPTADETH
jgi:hypothetical protein